MDQVWQDELVILSVFFYHQVLGNMMGGEMYRPQEWIHTDAPECSNADCECHPVPDH